jgi:hypothetical protein
MRAGRNPVRNGLLTVSPIGDRIFGLSMLLVDRAKSGSAFLTKVSRLGLGIRHRCLSFGQTKGVLPLIGTKRVNRV